MNDFRHILNVKISEWQRKRVIEIAHELSGFDYFEIAHMLVVLEYRVNENHNICVNRGFRIEELLERCQEFEKYADHKDNCIHYSETATEESCDCGLFKLLKNNTIVMQDTPPEFAEVINEMAKDLVKDDKEITSHYNNKTDSVVFGNVASKE